MTQLLIRDMKPEIIKRLKKRAKQNHRSLQGELKFIVENAVSSMTMEEIKDISQVWQKRLKSHSFTDSAILLREDRNR
jgi:antitoxin FitA